MTVPDERRGFRNVARRLALLACLVWPATLIATLQPRSWPLELATQLHVPYLWALVPAIVLSLSVRRYRLALAHAGFAAASVWFVAPAWFGADEPLPDAPAFDVVLVNVHTQNRDHDSLLELLRGDPPDLAVILEVNERWMAVLEQLRDVYPHIHAEPRPDNFGIALLARRPWIAVRTHVFGEAFVPSIVARGKFGGREIEIVATHPLPPMRPRTQALRDDQLVQLNGYLRRRTGPLVVAGDLNTSPWSGAFTSLLEGTRLRDARRGHGVLATWPDGRPWPLVPIDYVLVSPELTVADARVGPAIGSDHRPLRVRLQLRP